MEKASSLQERISRETVVLGEKSEACIKLLVQIGQDTAISSQHSKLVAKQKERIAHLKKVGNSNPRILHHCLSVCLFFCLSVCLFCCFS